MSASKNISRKLPFVLLKKGIIPRMNFIVGLPGENRKNIREMVKYLSVFRRKIRKRTLFTKFYPLPGSPAWSRLVEKEQKYQGVDLIGFEMARADWTKHFCGIKFEDLEKEFSDGCVLIYGCRAGTFGKA